MYGLLFAHPVFCYWTRYISVIITVDSWHHCGCCVVAATGRAGERSDQTGQHVQVFTHSRYCPGNTRSLTILIFQLKRALKVQITDSCVV